MIAVVEVNYGGEAYVEHSALGRDAYRCGYFRPRGQCVCACVELVFFKFLGAHRHKFGIFDGCLVSGTGEIFVERYGTSVIGRDGIACETLPVNLGECLCRCARCGSQQRDYRVYYSVSFHGFIVHKNRVLSHRADSLADGCLLPLRLLRQGCL